MHQPHAEPRRSIYYDYQVFDAWLPSQHPKEQHATVVIAGAGPIGLVTALALAIVFISNAPGLRAKFGRKT